MADKVAVTTRKQRMLDGLTLLLRQFFLILGKNFLLQIRRPIGSIFEMLVPLIAVAVLVGLRFGLTAFQPVDKCFVTFPSDSITIPGLLTSISGSDSSPLIEFGQERVFYVPSPGQETTADRVADIMRRRGQGTISMTALSSEDEFESELVLNDFGNTSTCFLKGAGIFFQNLSGPDIRYSIRLRQNPSPLGSWETVDRGRRAQPRGARVTPNFYLNEGFLQLQKIIDESIIEMLTNESINIEVNVRQFPYPNYVDDLFLQIVDFILPLFMILAFIYSAAVFVKELVSEKETRIRETMKMMGLSNWILVSTWFIKQFLFYLIPVFFMCVLLKYGRIFPASNLFLLFLFVLLYIVSGIAFCFLISVWFSSGRIGLMAAFIVWFISYLPYTFMAPNYESLSLGVKLGTCLISNTCVGFGTTVISFLELRQDGLLFSNFAQPLSLDDDLHMGWVIFMLFIDTIIYMVLYWYIDAVKPGKYGVPRPFYFLFLPSFWCGNLTESKVKPEEIAILSNSDNDPSAHEAEPNNLDIGISIKRLTKIYNRRNKKKRKVAVNNLSLNMYKGQITALLGHNGAGKTTTMSILTGLFTATSGEANINGYNITNEMDLIRRSLGICPQHNVLFDRLTISEHLIFFSMLKGLPTKKVKAEVDSMIEDLQLTDKRGIQSHKLSGGMKRKLSVGIALVGGSEVVVLDEPTSGMDPYARRATWDLLVKHKQGRTMLLTTHFMDEADLLGDRIAIMAEGKLKCSGSSLFLKGRYGVGYHMTMVKETGCDSTVVTDLVTRSITGSEQVTDVGAELSFILPSGSINQFPDLFDILDNQKSQLCISSFGVSVTTMEEVFIKVGEGSDETFQSRLRRQQANTGNGGHRSENGLEAPPSGDKINIDISTGDTRYIVESDGTETQTADIVFMNDDIDGPTPPATPLAERKNRVSPQQLESGPRQITLNTGVVLWFQQFYAMLLKRTYNSVRFWASIIWQFVLPLAFVLWALVLAKTLPGINTNEPPREMTINSSSLSDNQTFFWAQFGIDNDNLNFSFIESLGITDYFDYTQSINDMKSSVQDFSSAEQCCGYQYQILDKFCATKSVSQNYADHVCYGNSSFGYTACPECLRCIEATSGSIDSCTNPMNRELGDSFGGFTSDICPLPPSVPLSEVGTNPTGSLDDYNVYLAEELLRLSGNVLDANDFFLRFQGGFLIQPSPPTYSVCSCADPISQFDSLCDALSPAESVNTPGRRSDNFNFNSPNNSTAIQETCINTFTNNTCIQDYNNTYDWTVETCVQYSAALDNCRCSPNDDTCMYSLGTVSEDAPSSGITATLWYNNQPYHMAPAVLNAFYTILLRQNSSFRDYTITVTNDPLPRDLETEIDDANAEFLGFTISSTTMFGLSFLFASFIIFLVQEKDSKAKHLQYVSGVSATSYWLSSFVFDLLNAVIPMILTFILFAAFQIDGYKGENLGAVLLLLLLSNWAAIPVTYLFSFVFSNTLLAFSLMFVFFYFIALVFLIVIFIIQQTDANLANSLHYIFLLHPVYGLGIGLTDMYTNQGIRDVCTRNDFARLICERRGVDFAESIFEFQRPGIGNVFLYLAIEGVVLMMLTIIVERSFFIPEIRQLLSHVLPNSNGHSDIPLLEDDDVVNERKRVAELGNNNNEAVVIKNLVKLYRGVQSVVCPCFDKCQNDNKLAVNQINLIIPSGECFGLLGVNGAGKTTTFKMLTGDITPSAGTAKLAGYDIRTQLRLVQQRIGYCPQFDAVLERLTGRELLTMFARLRGIPEKEIKKAVETEINRLDLTKHANKRCGTYSGGNKRKLSTAVALVGNPPILLLDEPTTGMDPATRRFLWDALTGVIREGRSVILTSHSMEECEALCTRLAIMVNGQFKCLGSIQHLKSKFGSGYTLQIKINPNIPIKEELVRDSSRRSFRTASFRRQKSETSPLSPTGSITSGSKQVLSSADGYNTGPVHGFVNTNFPGSLLLEEHQGSVTYRIPESGVKWSSLFKLVESNKDALSIADYSVSQTTLDQVFINFAREQEEEVQL